MGLVDALKEGYQAMSNPGASYASIFGGSDAANTALSFIPGVGDYMASKDANEKNLASAREQMAFQERMSNTGYQRAVKDMQAAGLNPMLAYSQGPASTPSGAKAEIEPESRTGLANFASQLYGLNTQAKSARSQIALNEATAEVQAKQAPYVEANTEKARNEAKIAAAQATSAAAQARFDRKKAETDEKWYESEKWIRAASEGAGILGKAKDALNPLKGLINKDSLKDKLLSPNKTKGLY